MSEAPLFTVKPPLRCFHAGSRFSPFETCGRSAVWFRPGDVPDRGFYCTFHRRNTDVPVPVDALIQRVSLTMEILIAATTEARSEAQLEALHTLERAIQSVGGVISLHTATATRGRYGAAPVALPANASGLIGESGE